MFDREPPFDAGSFNYFSPLGMRGGRLFGGVYSAVLIAGAEIGEA